MTQPLKEWLEKKMEKPGAALNRAANWVVRIVGGVIFLALTWYAFRYTQYIVPMEGHEFPVDMKDSMLGNFLAAVLLAALGAGLFFLERRISGRAQKWIMRCSALFASLWQGVWGFLWITAADRCPKGDQREVYHCAKGFLEGDFSMLEKGAYCDLYPHQLGLAALEEGVFRLLGDTGYYVFQILFVLMIAGTAYFAYRIVREITERMAPAVLVCALNVFCAVPIFYTAWVYGEIPYVFFAMLAAWQLVRYLKRGKTGSLIAEVAALTMAVLLRQNALIMVVAFGLTAAVTALAKRDGRLLVAIVLAAALPSLVYAGIYGVYEQRSGYAHAKGLPTSSYVYIGLQETAGRYGWYYLNATMVYYNNDCDTERTAEALAGMIPERLEEMRAQPGYLTTFFKGKILSQWNAPLYQSMYFNYVHEDVHYPKVTAFFDRLSGDRFMALLRVEDRLQFVIYLGMLLYFLFGVKKDGNLLQHMLAVTIIGGFLFSVIWEAKTRYVFPYYMMMVPFAVIGYQSIAQIAEQLVFLKKKGYTGKV